MSFAPGGIELGASDNPGVLGADEEELDDEELDDEELDDEDSGE